MVAAKETAARADQTDPPSSSSRTDRLLAILVLEAISKKSDQDKAVLLSSVGFRNPEVAALLRTNPHTVSQHLSAARAKKATKRTKKPATRAARAEKLQ